MTCPTTLVVTDDCQTVVEVQSDPTPPFVVDLCQQGPPGPPGFSNLPFYDTNGVLLRIALISQGVPFYLADGTPAHLGLIG